MSSREGATTIGKIFPNAPDVESGKSEQLADLYVRMRPTPYGMALLALCVAIGATEGYDVQAMALAAPMLSRMWNLTSDAVGILLSISLMGQVIGGLLLAPLGDRWGRRPAMFAGLAIAGLSTLAGAFVPDYATMAAARFIAGLGLGMAIANTIALAMELVPSNWRSMAVVLVCIGYPLGAAAGTAVAGTMLDTHGVAAVFYVGGFATLAALLVGFVALPESPVITLRKSFDQQRLRRLFHRLGEPIEPSVRIVGLPTNTNRSHVSELFTPERRFATILLWVLNFANLSLLYFFVMWQPSLFVNSGLDTEQAARATSLFSASGIAGALILVWLMGRIGPIRTLGLCYVLTIVSVFAFATTGSGGVLFFVQLAACGFLIVGSQFCLSAVVNLFYPGPIRVTGSGYALGMGRLGGVFAPLAGGYVLAHVASVRDAFLIGLIPAAISLGALLLLRRLQLTGLRSE